MDADVLLDMAELEAEHRGLGRDDIQRTQARNGEGRQVIAVFRYLTHTKLDKSEAAIGAIPRALVRPVASFKVGRDACAVLPYNDKSAVPNPAKLLLPKTAPRVRERGRGRYSPFGDDQPLGIVPNFDHGLSGFGTMGTVGTIFLFFLEVKEEKSEFSAIPQPRGFLQCGRVIRSGFCNFINFQSGRGRSPGDGQKKAPRLGGQTRFCQ